MPPYPRVNQIWSCTNCNGLPLGQATWLPDPPAAPRACVQFSEKLAQGRIDFAPYVALKGVETIQTGHANA